MGRRNRGKPAIIRQVWGFNFDSEITRLDECLEVYSILSIDTEFPGCIMSCPWGSKDDQVYEYLRFNVNQTKMIQLGLTATDESGTVGGSWEFNFSDFDPVTDAHNPSSISFLKQNGFDFDKLEKHGIPLRVFNVNLKYLLHKHRISRWITFHGLYDIGYVVKALMEELPESMEQFGELVAMNMGNVRDLKYIAQHCDGLEEGKLGLERLGELLEQKRFGKKHHAGSDSLLTASLHINMLQRFQPDPKICDGFLYGLSTNLRHIQQISYSIPMPIPISMPVYCQPCYVTYY